MRQKLIFVTVQAMLSDQSASFRGGQNICRYIYTYVYIYIYAFVCMALHGSGSRLPIDYRASLHIASHGSHATLRNAKQGFRKPHAKLVTRVPYMTFIGWRPKADPEMRIASSTPEVRNCALKAPFWAH